MQSVGSCFLMLMIVRLENFTIGNPGDRADQLGRRLGGLVSENLTRVKEAAGNTIAAGVQAYLAARPVYRFKDDLKGLVLKAAVTDVAIEGYTVAIGLSLLNLSVMAAVCLLALLAVLVGVVQLVRPWGAQTQG
jgi:hypothetical protein